MHCRRASEQRGVRTVSGQARTTRIRCATWVIAGTQPGTRTHTKEPGESGEGKQLTCPEVVDKLLHLGLVRHRCTHESTERAYDRVKSRAAKGSESLSRRWACRVSHRSSCSAQHTRRTQTSTHGEHHTSAERPQSWRLTPNRAQAKLTQNGTDEDAPVTLWERWATTHRRAWASVRSPSCLFASTQQASTRSGMTRD